jgi:hypothetical protein
MFSLQQIRELKPSSQGASRVLAELRNGRILAIGGTRSQKKVKLSKRFGLFGFYIIGIQYLFSGWL